jgi:hypothetical protein
VTGNPHTSGGITTYTFSVADVNSGLTFTNHGDPVDTLTVKEILSGNIVATSQTLTVTDPPGSGDGTIVSDQPVSATSEDASVQSILADSDLTVGSPFTETLSGNSDSSAFLFKTNLDHHITDQEINFAQNNANNLLHLPTQPEDNGVHTVTDGAHPAHPHFGVNQLASFKFVDGGSAHPAHATGEDTSVQSAPANSGHHASADPEINDIANNHPLQQPAGNSLHSPVQHDDNSSSAVTDGAHPADQVDGKQLDRFKFADNGSGHPETGADGTHAADPQVDQNQLKFADDGTHLGTGPDGVHTAHPQGDGNPLDSFKFADNDSAHPGKVVPHDSPALTALLSNSSGTHGPAAPNLNVPGTVMSDAASDTFIFGKSFGHDTIADHKPDMTEIDHTVPAAIQHLLDTAHATNAVSMLDPNHATATQDMTKVQPHHQGDFHFA